ncbi:MAG: hypothetical protein R3A49_07880 [Acidimicrobiia bacterium]
MLLATRLGRGDDPPVEPATQEPEVSEGGGDATAGLQLQPNDDGVYSLRLTDGTQVFLLLDPSVSDDEGITVIPALRGDPGFPVDRSFTRLSSETAVDAACSSCTPTPRETLEGPGGTTVVDWEAPGVDVDTTTVEKGGWTLVLEAPDDDERIAYGQAVDWSVDTGWIGFFNGESGELVVRTKPLDAERPLLITVGPSCEGAVLGPDPNFGGVYACEDGLLVGVRDERDHSNEKAASLVHVGRPRPTRPPEDFPAGVRPTDLSEQDTVATGTASGIGWELRAGRTPIHDGDEWIAHHCADVTFENPPQRRDQYPARCGFGVPDTNAVAAHLTVSDPAALVWGPVDARATAVRVVSSSGDTATVEPTDDVLGVKYFVHSIGLDEIVDRVIAMDGDTVLGKFVLDLGPGKPPYNFDPNPIEMREQAPLSLVSPSSLPCVDGAGTIVVTGPEGYRTQDEIGGDQDGLWAYFWRGTQFPHAGRYTATATCTTAAGSTIAYPPVDLLVIDPSP